MITLLQLSHFFSPLFPSTLHPAPSSIPPPSLVYVCGSLASPFPILFSTYPCLFCTYQLRFLFSVTFSPSLLPTDNPPCYLHFCDSVPVLVVCLACFGFVLGSVVDGYELIVILLFIVFIFFFLHKSL